jgi:hypothetical protein
LEPRGQHQWLQTVIVLLVDGQLSLLAATARWDICILMKITGCIVPIKDASIMLESHMHHQAEKVANHRLCVALNDSYN